jgi:hypothetical protein
MPRARGPRELVQGAKVTSYVQLNPAPPSGAAKTTVWVPEAPPLVVEVNEKVELTTAGPES